MAPNLCKNVESLITTTPAFMERAAKVQSNSQVRQYYWQQAELLRNFEKDQADMCLAHRTSTSCKEKFDEKSQACIAERLAQATLLLNVSLLVLKGIAVYESGSYAVLSNVVDSAVDVTSGLIIWWVIFKSLEAIISQTVKTYLEKRTLLIMILTVLTKFTMWTICRRFSDANLQILAKDHFNDCISNFFGILFAILGQHLWNYLDPLGAILISAHLLCTWIRTASEQVSIISGKTASPFIVSRLIKVCLDHEPSLRHIETVLAYHYGLKYLVEVHVVLDEQLCLKEAHDISESLQRKMENLPYVERAFVHVDYNLDHKPDDEHNITLAMRPQKQNAGRSWKYDLKVTRAPKGNAEL
ncbi:Metal tolerance protein 4 [Trichinella pseudospiralis]|uniref:Metal tolerance protein 4 n=1 Tax=Trichinella pseudospiralis TaxID=6337 RepID=A0A0V1JJV0_TRIPS|nr:Metal tolerance protein 4 [Trichinella pseudospiralis]KRZ35254.1 Metal tolerance protein 4 [Trichinella pseudospiralis]